jgi:predicted O-linked N-acetylglucosamine transferase (SPINDLY family)
VQQDEETVRYKQLFHHWQDVAHLSDEALAQQIRRDEIDVLIDLSGHSAYNRLLTFARKPAPVQISWIGYVGTTGLDAMDYFIADAHLIPAELQSQFTEKILYLPASISFQPCANSPEVNPLPALGNGYFTFSCLARVNKLNRTLIATWAEILRRVPSSRLHLATMSGGGTPRLVVDWFKEEGISSERLVFVRTSSVADVLQVHHDVDLCLDTFPYNGSTSNNHSLWMGVPTLTLTGEFAHGRMGTTLAGLVGLEGFVTASKEDYIEKAVFWAQNAKALAELRAGLRQRFAESILQKPDVVTGAFVQALRATWGRWCKGLPPDTTVIP